MQLGERPRVRRGEDLLATCIINRPAVVGIDEREAPELVTLIRVGNSRRRELQDDTGERIPVPSVRDAGDEARDVGEEGRVLVVSEYGANELLQRRFVRRVGI